MGLIQHPRGRSSTHGADPAPTAPGWALPGGHSDLKWGAGVQLGAPEGFEQRLPSQKSGSDPTRSSRDEFGRSLLQAPALV